MACNVLYTIFDLFFPAGKLIVNCVTQHVDEKDETSTCVTIDYVTDEVSPCTELIGDPYVTPDAKHLVTVKYDGKMISVYQILENGNRLFMVLCKLGWRIHKTCIYFRPNQSINQSFTKKPQMSALKSSEHRALVSFG